jgi:hypothetical protein
MENDIWKLAYGLFGATTSPACGSIFTYSKEITLEDFCFYVFFFEECEFLPIPEAEF